MVSFFVDAADMLGVPKSVAAIYGICFASPEPLGFSEIQERLDISSGSISQGLRVLRNVGALKEVSMTSARRECFEPDIELRKLISHYLEERVGRQLKAGSGRLAVITKAIPSGPGGSAKVLKERLNSLRAWHDKSSSLLPVIKAFLKLT